MKALEENYLFIPPAVRYNPNLQPNAKILFGEIALRANEKGEALVGYDELPKMFSTSKKAVYHWIAALKEEGFLVSEIVRKKKVHYHAFLIRLKPADFEE